MANAYCDLLEVKRKLSGDVPNMGASHDQSLVDSILEQSRDLDRKVAQCRGEPEELFSFLAEQQYGRQIVYLSASPAPTEGHFFLTFDGATSAQLEFDSDGSDLQAVLEGTSSVGAGNVVVTGNPGGPWTVDFAGSLLGPQPVIGGFTAAMVPSDATIVVLPMIEGATDLFAERFFRPTPDLYGGLLLIDDCVEITQVSLYDSGGAQTKIYTKDTDYREFPLRGKPIEALKSNTNEWPEWPNVVGVKARWGYRTYIPKDAREAVVIESIRAHFAASAGMDDRIGTTPFGSVITAKAYTSKFADVVATYGNKLW